MTKTLKNSPAYKMSNQINKVEEARNNMLIGLSNYRNTEKTLTYNACLTVVCVVLYSETVFLV